MQVQQLFGWEDAHLHEFTAVGPGGRTARFAPPDDEDGWFPRGEQSVDESLVRLSQLVGPRQAKLRYRYDFGDDWDHIITVTGSQPLEGTPLPRCTAGAGAAPHEDSGGVWGWTDKVQAARDPRHPEHSTSATGRASGTARRSIRTRSTSPRSTSAWLGCAGRQRCAATAGDPGRHPYGAATARTRSPPCRTARPTEVGGKLVAESTTPGHRRRRRRSPGLRTPVNRPIFDASAAVPLLVRSGTAHAAGRRHALGRTAVLTAHWLAETVDAT
jgi:Plasmid pRiA4b ORF-3-like protein